ncbi:MAG: hypothetical protein V3W37_06405 [Candidatus Binatia bacterium]
MRDKLARWFLAFLLVWFGGWAVFIWQVGVSPMEALGIGTATGVFLKSFADMWQFYFRKKGPE